MQNFLIILLVAIASGSTFASDIYLPSFPALAQSFATPAASIQLTLTIYLLGFSLFQLVYGPLSDRYGRKTIILPGIALCMLGSAVCAWAPSLFPFFLGRFLQGAGAAAGMSLARTIARDAFQGDQLAKVFSLMGMVFAVSFAVAPILGGYLQTYLGWRSSFIFVFIYMTAMLIVAVVYLPETIKTKNPHATHLKTIAANLKILFSDRTFMGYSLCYGVTWAGMIAYAAMSPILFQTIMHLSAITYGHLAIAITLGLIAASFLNSSLVVRMGRENMMTLGLATMSIAALGMLIISAFGILNIAVVIVPMLLFVLGIGIVSANAGASALSPFGHMAGIAGALYGTLQIFITFIISWIITHLHAHSQAPLAATLTTLGIIATAFYFLVAKQPRKALQTQQIRQ